MRKALLPMLVSLALCGAATTAMVMSSAHAAPEPHKPLMVAATSPADLQLAANDAPDAPPRDLRRRAPADFAARLKEMCNDGYARQTAQLAYLENSLQLTAAERPLFARWKDAKLAIAHRHADNCAQRVSQRSARRDNQQRDTQGQTDRARPGPADRMAREEDRLKERLADLQSERPALEAFYNALSPNQKMQLARDGTEERRGEMMRHHRMFADAMGPRGQMGGSMDGGPMGGRPMGPPPPDAPPPER